jgi:hypothetical protein
MKRLVGAFNGGFQARHGEFGMQVDHVEYLPPKPYAATVMELADGSTGFGAWPGPESKSSNADIISFRQNLTALVQDEKFNLWQRSWWGGTPPGWPDRVHTARSGLCLTREGFVGYFYGANIAAEDLGATMVDARCSFGIHLDMNPGHVGFEFYNVAPRGQLGSLDHPLRAESEAEGTIPDMPDLVFRARRMVRGMGSTLFPRYVQRQARDFFYLTSRPLLPGSRIELDPSAVAGEGTWHTDGLPQQGFPLALATSWACARGLPATSEGNCSRIRILRIDPRAARPEPGGGDDPTIVALSATAHGTQTLWWNEGVLSFDSHAPGPHAAALVAGVALNTPAATTATAAVGIDDDGMLDWVELAPEIHPDARSAVALGDLLSRLGCTAGVAVAGDGHALISGNSDVSGERPAPPAPITVRLVRARSPDAHRVFEDTPVVPFDVWQPLQAKRIRYLAKPAGSPTRTEKRGSPPPEADAGDEVNSQESNQ